MGRRSLSGPIPHQFQLKETPSTDYLQRTEWNVRDSDGTVIFSLGPKLSGGSLKTMDYVHGHHKAGLHLSNAKLDTAAAAEALLAFIEEHGIETLNVAGPRESKEPGIHDWVREVLETALFT